jgi:hypothetical protein
MGCKALIKLGIKPWVDLGMDDMTLHQRRFQIVMDMGRERSEALVIPVEAMDIYN